MKWLSVKIHEMVQIHEVLKVIFLIKKSFMIHLYKKNQFLTLTKYKKNLIFHTIKKYLYIKEKKNIIHFLFEKKTFIEKHLKCVFSNNINLKNCKTSFKVFFNKKILYLKIIFFI